MNIGELFVVLGAKTDASWAQAQQRIRAMAQLANQKAREMAAVARAEAQQQARDMAAAFKANAAAARAQAREIAAAHRESAAAARAAAREQVAAAKIAAKEQAAAVKAQWAGLHAGVKDRISAVKAANGINWASSTASPFQQGINWATATGDPFNPQGGGAGGGGKGKGKGPNANGKNANGRGRGQPQGSRFGALGEISNFRKVLFGAGVYQAVTTFGELADSYTNLQNRIGTVTTSQEQANAVFSRLRAIATNTRTSLETTAESYVRITNATSTLKISEEDRYKFLERLNMAMATSGATTAEMSSGLTQMTQALAKGKLDGDEFKSIAENMPNILKILQTHLKVTEGQLRRMSKDGNLTREKIVAAFLAADDIQRQFLKTAPTFASKWQKFKDDMMVSFGRMAQDTDLVKNFSLVLEGLAAVLMFLADRVLKPLVITMGKFVQGLKDGKWWAYALAGVIGLNLIPALVGIARWVLGFPMARLTAIRTALGLGGAATGAAAGGAATVAGKTGAGAGAGGAAAGGLAWLGPVGWSLLGAYVASEATGGPMEYSSEFGFGNQKYLQDKYGSRGGGSQVAIGPTTVNIYAKDMADAENKFSAEQIDRMNRHAAAAFNR